ncbi:MAG: hypothetical protein ABI835_11920, partial [Chloroflexota bacterium]
MIVPYISREDVRAALGSLIHHSRKMETNGLRHLLLVDLRVTAPEMPGGDSVREHAVRDVLVAEIIAALSEKRTTFGLVPLNVYANVEAVRNEVNEAVKTGTPELMIWSPLYLHYVRSDLGWS